MGWVIDIMGWVGLGPENLDTCPSLECQCDE